MSKKNLAKEIENLSNQRGGSHATREARALTARDFAKTMQDANIQIREVKNIGTKEIKIYSQSLLNRGLSKRTIANRLSHIRAALKASGKESMLKREEISNGSLGASGGSRIGTKTAMSDEDFLEIHTKLRDRDEGVATIMSLQRSLGLRLQEAIRGSTTENLNFWMKQLEFSKTTITKGTKGGRKRTAIIQNVERAIEAVKNALIISKKNGGRVVNASDLKSAINKVKNDYRFCGMVGKKSSHSLRYAWAKEQHQHYLDDGFSEYQARKQLSQDLGHGDGRGRYVAMVYLR